MKEITLEGITFIYTSKIISLSAVNGQELKNPFKLAEGDIDWEEGLRVNYKEVIVCKGISTDIEEVWEGVWMISMDNKIFILKNNDIRCEITELCDICGQMESNLELV